MEKLGIEPTQGDQLSWNIFQTLSGRPLYNQEELETTNILVSGARFHGVRGGCLSAPVVPPRSVSIASVHYHKKC